VAENFLNISNCNGPLAPIAVFLLYFKSQQEDLLMTSIITSFSLIAAIGISGAWIQGMATVDRVKEARLEMLGRYCDAGLSDACKALTRETGGQCAGPTGSGCRFDSNVTL
jgi:DNA-binding Xre family transcriptional regulator